MTNVTAKRWLSVLEASFLVYILRPHHANFGKRLIKSPKLYFLDSGLLCYLLRIRSPEDLRIHALRGAVFESWVVSEAVKNFVHRGLEADAYFWRDSTGHEIDLLIDLGRELLPVEAKSGQTFAADFLDGIKYWRKLAGQKDRPAAVVYGGDDSYMREDTAVMFLADVGVRALSPWRGRAPISNRWRPARVLCLASTNPRLPECTTPAGAYRPAPAPCPSGGGRR